MTHLAEQYHAAGQWELEELTLVELVEKYPDEPAGLRAMQQPRAVLGERRSDMAALANVFNRAASRTERSGERRQAQPFDSPNPGCESRSETATGRSSIPMKIRPAKKRRPKSTTSRRSPPTACGARAGSSARTSNGNTASGSRGL